MTRLSTTAAERTPMTKESAAPVAMPGPRPRRRRRKVAAVTAALVVAVVLIALVSAGVGQYEVSPAGVLGALRRAVLGHAASDSQADSVLWAIRFPRVALGLLAGACLAVAGTVMQGVFANPLAEPSIIGVSSGASVGATAVIVAGVSVALPWTLPVCAFAGAIVVTAIVWGLSRSGGKAAVLTLVLTGIAINAVATALTSFLIFLGDTSSRQQVIFWQLGTLANATWSQAGAVAIVFALGFSCCLCIRRQLDVLSLGDAAAATAGVRVEALRAAAILLACLLTAIAVAFGGVIAFVGLIVPAHAAAAGGPVAPLPRAAVRAGRRLPAGGLRHRRAHGDPVRRPADRHLHLCRRRPAVPAVAAPNPARTTMTVNLAVEHACLTLGRRTILDDVSLELSAGTVTAIIGPNGAGKSTLLAVAAGTLTPSTGTVTIGGHDLRSLSTRALARRRAVMPQDSTVAFPFTVHEVVAMGRTAWPDDPRVAGDIVEEALELTGIAELADRNVMTLSGGERQLTSFARVIVQATPVTADSVILLDEPTAAMDIAHAEATLSVARRLADDGAAVGVVLHDIDAAAAYADRMVLMEHGRIRATGTVRQVCTAALLSSVYATPLEVFEREGDVHVRPVRPQWTRHPLDPHRSAV